MSMNLNLTANFTKKTKPYSEVAPHNHRTNYTNSNVDKRFIQDDVLNQQPFSYRNMMLNVWLPRAVLHDYKRVKNGHKDYYYSEKRGNNRKMIKNDYRQLKYHHFITPTALQRLHGMFKDKQQPYRTISIGVGDGLSRLNSWYSYRASSGDNLHQITHNEGKAMSRVPFVLNHLLSNIKICNFDNHVDEIHKRLKAVEKYKRLKREKSPRATKYYKYFIDPNSDICYVPGGLHGQGRNCFWAYSSKTGRPSKNFNKAMRKSLKPYSKLIQKINAKYNNKNNVKLEFYKSGKHKGEVKNNRELFSAFNLFISYEAYKTVTDYMKQVYPEANVNYHFVRTGQAAGSHEAMQAQRDNKRKLFIQKLKIKEQNKHLKTVKNKARTYENKVETDKKNEKLALDDFNQRSEAVDDENFDVETNSLVVDDKSKSASSASKSIVDADKSLEIKKRAVNKFGINMVWTLNNKLISKPKKPIQPQDPYEQSEYENAVINYPNTLNNYYYSISHSAASSDFHKYGWSGVVHKVGKLCLNQGESEADSVVASLEMDTGGSGY